MTDARDKDIKSLVALPCASLPIISISTVSIAAEAADLILTLYSSDKTKQRMLWVTAILMAVIAVWV